MNSAHGTIKDPSFFLLCHKLKLLLAPLHLRFEVTLGHACLIALCSLAVLLKLLKLFFVQDTLDFALLQTLFPSHHA